MSVCIQTWFSPLIIPQGIKKSEATTLEPPYSICTFQCWLSNKTHLSFSDIIYQGYHRENPAFLWQHIKSFCYISTVFPLYIEITRALMYYLDRPCLPLEIRIKIYWASRNSLNPRLVLTCHTIFKPRAEVRHHYLLYNHYNMCTFFLAGIFFTLSIPVTGDFPSQRAYSAEL